LETIIMTFNLRGVTELTEVGYDTYMHVAFYKVL